MPIKSVNESLQQTNESVSHDVSTVLPLDTSIRERSTRTH